MTFLITKTLVIVMILSCSLLGCEKGKEREVANTHLMGMSTLSVIGQQISPTYSPNVSEFFLQVGPHEESITLLITSTARTTIEVNKKVFFGEQTYELSIGVNVFYIQVISSVEMRGYSLTVTRKP